MDRLRRFRVVRTEDESGVSGTGVVAVGVEFVNSGAVVWEWLNDENPDLDTTQNGIKFAPGPDGVEDAIEVHGHGGRTEIEWVDDHPEYTEDDEDDEDASPPREGPMATFFKAMWDIWGPYVWRS